MSPDRGLRERARALHAEALVVDGHNDLAWRLRATTGLDLERARLDVRSDEGHTDLVRLREGGVDAQWWAAWVPPDEASGGDAAVLALEQVDLIRRVVARWPERLGLARTAEDVERIAASGRTASLIGVEGGHAIAGSLGVLRVMHACGVRCLTLTHAASHDWADASTDAPRHGGLSEFGREVVRELNGLGMLADLSHASDDCARDAMDVSRAPPFFSHSGARAVADHPRNVPDELLTAVGSRGGIVMVNFYSGFVVPESAASVRDFFGARKRLRRRHAGDENAFRRAWDRWMQAHPVARGTVEHVVDHVAYIAEVGGVDHVGLGSDFDGVPDLPEGLGDVAAYPAVTEALLRRGFADAEVRKILGQNFMRVFRRAEDVASEAADPEPPSRG